MMHDYPRQEHEQQEIYQSGYHETHHFEAVPQESLNASTQYKYTEPAIYYLPVAGPRDNTLAASLSYSLCWFSGLLFLLFGGENRFVRFHALQSLLFFGSVNLIDIALIRAAIMLHHYFGSHVFIMLLIMLLLLLINCIAFVGWFVGLIQAARGFYHKMPFVGNIAMNMIKAPKM